MLLESLPISATLVDRMAESDKVGLSTVYWAKCKLNEAKELAEKAEKSQGKKGPERPANVQDWEVGNREQSDERNVVSYVVGGMLLSLRSNHYCRILLIANLVLVASLMAGFRGDQDGRGGGGEDGGDQEGVEVDVGGLGRGGRGRRRRLRHPDDGG